MQSKAPRVALAVCLMLIVGHFISQAYPSSMPIAILPVFEGYHCSATFLFALTFICFEKMLSTALKQRVRGLWVPNTTPLPTRFVDADMPLLKLISGIFNIVFFYKLMKKFAHLRYVVSVTRV